ncbi:hypothetical protein SAMN06272737_10219 [Blastococcus mobilis]|uniref:N-acetyltransferase domain-containing protein n=2 Tax=Blastococcus mobilis TaxID=1938746 RepID=A0A238V4L3_9ACTN|nr:hypothetical protein SAMN06272737_10219 [Blastococcus mobilis]
MAHDPIAAPLGARFLAALADRVGCEPGVLDAVLVAPPGGGVPQTDIPVQEVSATGLSHPRVQRAFLHRTDVRVWATPDGAGLLTIGRGVAGRLEASLEVETDCRGRGLGTALSRAARSLAAEPLWAQVAPANTASLRAFLTAGYRPVGAEVLFGS